MAMMSRSGRTYLRNIGSHPSSGAAVADSPGVGEQRLDLRWLQRSEVCRDDVTVAQPRAQCLEHALTRLCVGAHGPLRIASLRRVCGDTGCTADKAGRR